MKKNKELSSFRDPSGYVYYKDNQVYRRVNKAYLNTFKKFNFSNLSKELLKRNLLVNYEIIKEENESMEIKVEKIPFISYPYEWCFNQLKDAAILTLEIEKIALNYDFSLKDASAYNVQFVGSKPVFIDLFSFTTYEEGLPWGAYGQFCRHFLAPLVLMSKVNESLNCLLKSYIDGIPLDLASDILKNRGGLIAYEHIKLHNKAIKKNNKKIVKNINVPKRNIINLIDMMIRQINKLNPKDSISEWSDYYNNTNYTDESFDDKIVIVNDYLDKIKLNKDDVVCDIGANDGTFSKIALKNNSYVLALDIDYNAVKRNYNNYKHTNHKMLPLLFDFNNPSPGIGFDLNERKSIEERADFKCIMALALVHHICISNNIPFEYLFQNLQKYGRYLIIEFVPKDDSKVQELLSTREDIFENYDINNFEKASNNYFKIILKQKVKSSKRVIYLMENKYEKSESN